MSDITLKQLAAMVGTSPEKLFEQFLDAGVPIQSSEQLITNSEKTKLLEFLRRSYTKGQPGSQSTTVRAGTIGRQQVLASRVRSPEAAGVTASRPPITRADSKRRDETSADTLIRVRQELAEVRRAKRQAEVDLEVARVLEQLLSSDSTPPRSATRKNKLNFSSERRSALVEKFDRDIRKLKVRELDLASTAQYDAIPIVIDGSNLCYANHTDQIGLEAVRALVDELIARKFDVTVIFDQSTARRLDISNQHGAQMFDGRARALVADGKADEPILRQAALSDGYIISNDAFIELPELRDKLPKHRILNHRICNGSIDVVGLGVQIYYQPKM